MFEMGFMHSSVVCGGKKKRTGQLTICAVVKIRKGLLPPLCGNEHKIGTHYIVERQD